MQKVKRRTFSGCVCEQEIYFVYSRVPDIRKSEPRPRFENEAERELHKAGISRRKHARTFNANYSPASLYSTLTFDDEDEVHTFKEARKIRDLFYRRLKYAYPDAKINLYMGRGKHTSRIHFHMVSDGIPADYIKKQWIYGDVTRIDNLRAHNYYNGVDHGQDYTGLANYLFDHWTPEQGGHRWKQSKNLKQPDREPAKVIITDYSEKRPPRAPKGYFLVETKSTKWGYLYFRYVLTPPPKERPRKKKKAEGSTV